jgi:hypothetical protein
MSLPSCIPGLIEEGAIRKGDGEKAQAAYDRHYRRLANEMSPEAAAAEASRIALDELDYDAALKARRGALTILAQSRMDAETRAHFEKTGESYGALIGMLNEVEVARQRIEFQQHAGLMAFIERHRRDLLGRTKDATGMRDVVIERHGGDTGNANAKLFSDAVGESQEYLRERFNRAGGDIGQRADYGMTHSHDPLKVRGAGYAQWRADLLAEIAPERMTDPLSGQPFTADRIEEAVAASWETIRTGGLTANGGGAAAKMLANRRSDHRFFVFKDGEAWLRYNDKYGTGNPFDAIMGHIGGMARDIAFMERFGPNPGASWKRGTATAAALDAGSAKAHSGSVAGTSFGAYRADKMWRFLNGDYSVPVLLDGRIAGPLHRGATGAVHAARNVITSAFLGSSQLTAISDINTQLFARHMNGLPVMRGVTGYLSLLSPLSHADRRRAIRLGLGMRDASRAMLGISRYVGELAAPRWSETLSDGVLRLSGINKFTEAGQRAFGLDFLGQLAEEASLPWAGLSDSRRATFERHGIAPADWDVMRRQTLHYEGNAAWMDWQAVAKADQRVSDKMMNMVLRETRAAVQEGDAQAVSLLRFGRPGTIAGEIGANTFQFKSFPVALMMTQAQRVAEIGRRLGPGAAGAYAASFFIGMTTFGAMALQLREISKGRDMRPMDNLEFWADAASQGGGIGIFGDLIGSFFNDRLNSIYGFFGGPMVGAAEDAKRVVQSFVPDEEGRTHGGRETVRFMRRYTPGGNLWYARAAIEHNIFDQLQREVDPNYDLSWQRMQDMSAQQGQGEWWRRGEALPARAPQRGREPEAVGP